MGSLGRNLLNFETELAGVKDITRQQLKAIADAIRTQDGTTDKIAPIDFPNRILKLPQGEDTSQSSAVPMKCIGNILSYINNTICIKEGNPAGSEGFTYGKASEFASRILALEGKKPSRLPAGYTEVEYIEMTSESAVLKPSVSIRSNSDFEGIFAVSAKPSATRYILTCVPASSTTYVIYLYCASSGSVYGRCGTTSNAAYESYYSYPHDVTFKLKLSTSSKTVHVDTASKTAYWSNTVTTDYIVLGKNGTSRKALVGGRIKYMKATCSTYAEGNTNYPVYNWELVPCITDDGKIGLYDLINHRSFLATATYWSAGPAV